MPFLNDKKVKLIGVEAGGKGLKTGEHAARFSGGTVGIAQGYKTYFFQDDEGQMKHTHSIAAGLDYVGVSPILSFLHDEGRVDFISATDSSIIDATRLLIRKEGIIPALECSHAFAGIIEDSNKIIPGEKILVNLSGRGDKDIFNIAEALQDKKWFKFLEEKVNKKI